MNDMKKLSKAFESVLSQMLEMKQVVDRFAKLHVQTVRVFVELAKLNNSEIDNILDKYGIVISDDNGQKIFPREQPSVKEPQIIFEYKN